MPPRTKNLRALALVPVLLAGCGEEAQPRHVHVLPEPEPEPTTRTLAGKEAVEFRGHDGSAEIGVDLDRAIVQAHCETEEGWVLLPGSGAADGTFRIEGLPEVPCFIRVDHFVNPESGYPQNDYILTAANELDLGTVATWRGDIAYPTEPTVLEAQIDGLAAFDPDTDFFGIYAPNARVVNYNGRDLVGFPAEGETSATLTYDWGSMWQPLIEQAKGDRALLTQWRIRTNDNAYTYFAPLRSLELEPFTIENGGTTRIGGTFVEPPVLEYRLNWARSQFEALATEIHPEAGATTYPAFIVRTAPSAVDDTWNPLSFGTEILGVEAAWEGTGDVDLGTFEVPNPFPSDTIYDWYEVMFPVSVPWLFGMEAEINTRVAVFNTKLPTDDEPAVPLISPVRNLKIEDQPATGGLEGVGVQPRISWEAPRIGTATSYEIRILEPGFGDLMFGGMFNVAATLYVDASVTDLQIPPELLDERGIYTLLVRAVSQPGIDATATPRRLALPYAYADALSEPFTP